MSYKKVGEVVRIEYDQQTEGVRIIVEIFDQLFKTKILHDKGLQDLIMIDGRSIVEVEE